MKRQKGIHPCFIIAVALDPRFKHMQGCGIHPNEVETIWEKVLQLIITYKTTDNENDSTVSSAEDDNDNDNDNDNDAAPVAPENADISFLTDLNLIVSNINDNNNNTGSAYIPLVDTTTLIHITTVLARFPRRKVILVGDLNLDLDSCESARDMQIADILATSGLLNMHRHFKSPGRYRRPATWYHKRKGNIIKSRPDYFLCSDWRIIRRYGIRDPRHIATDHKLVLGTLISNTLRENKCYLHGRSKFPHRTPQMGPSSRLDSLCDDIEEATLPPVSTPE